MLVAQAMGLGAMDSLVSVPRRGCCIAIRRRAGSASASAFSSRTRIGVCDGHRCHRRSRTRLASTACSKDFCPPYVKLDEPRRSTSSSRRNTDHRACTATPRPSPRRYKNPAHAERILCATRYRFHRRRSSTARRCARYMWDKARPLPGARGRVLRCRVSGSRSRTSNWSITRSITSRSKVPASGAHGDVGRTLMAKRRSRSKSRAKPRSRARPKKAARAPTRARGRAPRAAAGDGCPARHGGREPPPRHGRPACASGSSTAIVSRSRTRRTSSSGSSTATSSAAHRPLVSTPWT